VERRNALKTVNEANVMTKEDEEAAKRERRERGERRERE